MFTGLFPSFRSETRGPEHSKQGRWPMRASLNHLCLFGFFWSVFAFLSVTLQIASSTPALPAASVTLHTQIHTQKKYMQTMASFDKERFDGRMKSRGPIWLWTEEKREEMERVDGAVKVFTRNWHCNLTCFRQTTGHQKTHGSCLDQHRK